MNGSISTPHSLLSHSQRVQKLLDAMGHHRGQHHPLSLHRTHAGAVDQSLPSLPFMQKLLDAGVTIVGKNVMDEMAYSVTGKTSLNWLLYCAVCSRWLARMLIHTRAAPHATLPPPPTPHPPGRRECTLWRPHQPCCTGAGHGRILQRHCSSRGPRRRRPGPWRGHWRQRACARGALRGAGVPPHARPRVAAGASVGLVCFGA